MKFNELNLNKDLLSGIIETGYIECMPVQEVTLASTLKGKDVCVQSQTGTGKTAAFLVSIFQLFIEDPSMKGKKALIIVPTRELAVQIEDEARQIGRKLNFIMGSFYGGVGYTEQEKLIADNVDIIIGTPGRLLDFTEQRKLNFKDIGILIIDEADRLFDMGFLPDIRRMIKQMRPPTERKTMLFSATLNSRVRDLAWEYMNNPVEIEMNPEQITVDNIHQELYHVGKDEKMKLLLGILKKEHPENALIFTNMKKTAHEVSRRLEMNGYKCQYIMGDLPQTKRLKIIEGVKSGKIKYLVATEVAARGLHIDDLELVLNYDLPEDCENYVHRIGRTARAGKSGKAISLACEKYVYNLAAIEAFTKNKIPVAWADESLYLEDKSQGMHFSLSSQSRGVERQKPSRSRYGNQPGKQTGTIHRNKPGSKPGFSGKRYSGNKKDERSAAKKPGKTYVERTQDSFIEEYDERIPSAVMPAEANKSRKTNKHAASKVMLKKEAVIKKKKIKARKNGTIEERMEYYRKKYGANFQPGPELLKRTEKEPKISFIRKLFSSVKKKSGKNVE